MDESPDAVLGPKRSVACQICTTNPAKYTCPRCGFKTCSLKCTTVHKSGSTTNAACSGIKEDNAGGFVAMNTYGHSAFVNDYVFLEEVGRKVGDWGRDIQDKKLLSHGPGSRGAASTGGGKGIHPMRGGNRGNTRGARRRTKRETLRDVLLERADIDMQLCPEGMERRKMNQSSWDAKSNTGYLTIQYRFHRTTVSTASNHDRHTRPSLKRKTLLDDRAAEVIPLLTHRNDIDLPIVNSLLRAVEERCTKDGSPPPWIRDMILGDATVSTDEVRDTNETQNGCVVLIRGSTVPLENGAEVPYQRVDTMLPLVEALRSHTFAEFPTLEVVQGREWSELGPTWGVKDEEEGEMGESDGEEQDDICGPRRKRLKVDEEAGKKLLGGLISYGEDEDEEGDISDSGAGAGQEKKPTGLLEMLDYSSESSEESESESMELHAVYPDKTVLDAVLAGEDEEADWDDE